MSISNSHLLFIINRWDSLYFSLRKLRPNVTQLATFTTKRLEEEKHWFDFQRNLLSHFSPHFWNYLMYNNDATKSFFLVHFLFGDHLLAPRRVYSSSRTFQMTNHILLIAYHHEINKEFHFQIVIFKYVLLTHPRMTKAHLIK